MEVLVATMVIGLLAALVAHSGSGRRGRDRTNHLRADVRRYRDVEFERDLAGDAKASHRPVPAAAPIVDLRLDEEIFAAVGLRLETARARAFAEALGQAALDERTDDGGWPRRAFERVAWAVPIEHLAGVTEDLGLGHLVLAPGNPDAEAANALRAPLIHVLRDPLQDALRLAAGQRPFWARQALADPRCQPAIRDAA